MKYPNACKACRGLSKKLAASLLALCLAAAPLAAQAEESALSSSAPTETQAPETEPSAAPEAEEEPSQQDGVEGEATPQPEETLQPEESQPEESHTEESQPEESPAPSESPAPTEEPASGEEAVELEEETYSAQPLLVTGGHATYMDGYGDGTFRPDNVMTRAEAAKVIYELLTAKPPVSSSSFSDVKSGQWYYTAVNALAQKDIVGGYGDGTFQPNAPITRVEFLKILCVCMGTTSGGSVTFNDVSSGHWGVPVHLHRRGQRLGQRLRGTAPSARTTT